MKWIERFANETSCFVEASGGTRVDISTAICNLVVLGLWHHYNSGFALDFDDLHDLSEMTQEMGVDLGD
jgi:hypothetical protein